MFIGERIELREPGPFSSAAKQQSIAGRLTARPRASWVEVDAGDSFSAYSSANAWMSLRRNLTLWPPLTSPAFEPASAASMPLPVVARR